MGGRDPSKPLAKDVQYCIQGLVIFVYKNIDVKIKAWAQPMGCPKEHLVRTSGANRRFEKKK
jgi:hypothetical protein